MLDSLTLATIITPSFNQAAYLEQTIQSVLTQNYPHIEYIIIDGGSTDGSIEIIRKYAGRLAYWISEKDRGQAHAINKGLLHATGSLLSWINSDDLLAPGAVTRAVQYLNEHPDIDVVYGYAPRIDENGYLLPSKIRPTPVFDKNHVIGECLVTQPGAFWRRSLTDQIGLLNEELHHVMDHELWIRMALINAQFVRLEGAPMAYFRLSQATKTVSQLDQSGFENLQVLNQLLSDPTLPTKLALSPKTIQLQAQRARALACLKIFQGKARQPSHIFQALQWLGQALRFYPPVLFSRSRLIIAAGRDMLRLKLGN